VDATRTIGWGHFDDDDETWGLELIDNPCGPKLLPMSREWTR